MATIEERKAAHYRAVKSIDRILKRLEKDGATNEDERYDLVTLRKAVDLILGSVEPFDVKMKRFK